MTELTPVYDVPDAIVHDFYEGVDFTDDDFTC